MKEEEINNIMLELERISALKKEVKRRSMIWNCQLKEAHAKKYKLPIWAFYHIPYKEFTIDNFSTKKKAVALFEKYKKLNMELEGINE